MGAKSTAKSEAAAAKQAEQARKKAEKEALLREEEANIGSSKGAKGAKAKGAGLKSKGGLDLSGLDDPKLMAKMKGGPSGGAKKDAGPGKPGALSASNIDDALDALALTSAGGQSDKLDRHPERRFPAAYKAYEERRLEEMKDEKGLRRNQKIDQIRKEFDKHPDNPFNQANARFNSTKEEMEAIKSAERQKLEDRLGGQS
ncbi:hypothetical protein BDY21DRAFT_204957 [Lineolata rhizophorae]|uniref:Coiled-coil domain-containing protein n=1 Tax=Lineolata rhizophorae TaxID=578093 RepID=A0A6A6P3B5_9PEZI|nr:hypothetical protein BDY21DRAFT_204957 [Lineolata rhizophorae]